MKAFRTVVVALIVGAMFSPAMAAAKSETRTPPAAVRPIASTTVALANGAASAASPQTNEAAQYAQREQQSPGVQDFKGGAIILYFGSGVVLALIIIILLLA